MVAVAQSRREVWACHQSALALHGLPTGRTTPDRATVTVDQSHGVVHRRPAHDIWPTALPEHHRDSVRGVPTVSVARAVVDACRHGSFHDGLIGGDAALRRAASTRADIDEAVEFCAGWPGIRGARRAVDHADGAWESPLESLSFARCVELGLPLPRCRITIVDRWGDPDGIVDFLWPDQRVIGEADGDIKYLQDLAGAASANLRLLAEKRRQSRLERDYVVIGGGGAKSPATRGPFAD